MTESESVAEQAQVRDSTVLREAARSLREMLDRGNHHGITPAAMFALCRMLDTAANNDASATPQLRLDLLNTAAEILKVSDDVRD